jgi:hypothetical protein
MPAVMKNDVMAEVRALMSPSRFLSKLSGGEITPAALVVAAIVLFIPVIVIGLLVVGLINTMTPQ